MVCRVTSSVLAAALVLVATLAGVVAAPAPGAEASPAAAQESIDRLNAERASRGLPALRVAGDLSDVARRWSGRMAAEARLRHNPNLRSEVCCWVRIAENVGTASGGSGHVGRIHQGFMGSSGHRANILDPKVQEVGVGVVVDSDGRMWLTQVFRGRSDAGAVPTPTASPTPTRAPVARTAAPRPTPSATPPPAPEAAPVDEPATVKLKRWRDVAADVLLFEDAVLIERVIEAEPEDGPDDKE